MEENKVEVNQKIDQPNKLSQTDLKNNQQEEINDLDDNINVNKKKTQKKNIQIEEEDVKEEQVEEIKVLEKEKPFRPVRSNSNKNLNNLIPIDNSKSKKRRDSSDFGKSNGRSMPEFISLTSLYQEKYEFTKQAFELDKKITNQEKINQGLSKKLQDLSKDIKGLQLEKNVMKSKFEAIKSEFQSEQLQQKAQSFKDREEFKELIDKIQVDFKRHTLLKEEVKISETRYNNLVRKREDLIRKIVSFLGEIKAIKDKFKFIRDKLIYDEIKKIEQDTNLELLNLKKAFEPYVNIKSTLQKQLKQIQEEQTYLLFKILGIMISCKQITKLIDATKCQIKQIEDSQIIEKNQEMISSLNNEIMGIKSKDVQLFQDQEQLKYQKHILKQQEEQLKHQELQMQKKVTQQTELGEKQMVEQQESQNKEFQQKEQQKKQYQSQIRNLENDLIAEQDEIESIRKKIEEEKKEVQRLKQVKQDRDEQARIQAVEQINQAAPIEAEQQNNQGQCHTF